MKSKILFLFLILLSSFFIVSQAKYIKQENITIATVNIDTMIPKIELLNIQNIRNKKNEIIFYDVIVSLKVVESNIKENNINKIKVMINETEVNGFEVIKKESLSDEIYYEVIIKEISDNQNVKVIIPEEIVIDNANNKNEYQIIEHKIL